MTVRFNMVILLNRCYRKLIHSEYNIGMYTIDYPNLNSNVRLGCYWFTIRYNQLLTRT